jgi:GMP synthase (glutamine-hydrolysing)
MKLLIVHNTEPADVSFNRPLLKAVGETADFDTVGYRDVSLDMVAEYGGVILSGVPRGYGFETIEDRAKRIKDWVHAKKAAILAICLGHQSIGVAADKEGVEIKRDKEGEHDLIIVSQRSSAAILQGLPPDFPVVTSHRASINLPRGYELVASSDTCEVQAMKRVDDEVHAVQFHPEDSPKHVKETIFKNFADIALKHYKARESQLLVPEARLVVPVHPVY